MTNQESNQKQYPQNYPPYEDEINLIDYLKVLWKWKWLIIAGTLICAVAAAVISLRMPKIYEISTVIEPGIADVKDDGSFTYIDSVANITGKINGDIYSKRIQKALNLDPLKTGVKFKSANVKGANMVNISSQWQEVDTELGVKATGQLVQLLSDSYGKIIERRKGDYDKQLTLKMSSIEKTQNDIKLQQATLKTIRQRKGELSEEIKGVKENTEKIVQQRDSLLERKSPDKDISLLLYSTTIQQNVAYFSQLSNQVYDFRTREKRTENEIDKLSKNIDDIKAEINALNLEKGLISNIKVIQEPEVSLYPVKPKKKQIVLLATVVALFMAVFLAFFIEYIKNATRSTKQTNNHSATDLHR